MSTLTRHDLERVSSNLYYRLHLLSQTRRRTDRLLATRFNVFDYIQPNENELSDVIRDLLDVNGTHGQGDSFLHAFLEVMCAKSCLSGQRCSIGREVTTSMIENTLRRMDILIDLGSFGVAIENKPWAGEQDDQIHDYVAHLEKRFAGQFVIVYLSASGGKPTSISEAEADRLLREDKLVLAAYAGRFRDWLERCYRASDAEKIRWFLTDFMSYAKQTFPVVAESLTEPSSNE